MMNRRIVPVVLIAAALLLFTIGVVNAELQSTNVLRAWDDKTNQFENGMLTMKLDNNLEPFYTVLAFDAKMHANACGAGTQSQWAGDAEIGLYHTDTPGPGQTVGAPGFAKSQDWSIVNCSTFATNRYPAAADILATCVDVPTGPSINGPNCILKTAADVITPCTTGNCQDEIVTQFHITLNKDCNTPETVDAPFTQAGATSGAYCMYWAGVKPPPTQPVWSGNIQVRYGAGQGGDKTINFNKLVGPNAVTLSRLTATAGVLRGSLAAWAMGLVLVGAAVFVWRRKA